MSPDNPAHQFLPSHLSKYVVEQRYEDYTPLDQAVWRYCMRQLRDYLAKTAHPLYEKGLDKTGITIDTIPRIDSMSKCLQEFGWTAVPVSGFIPPAAFMELQSLSILPIAQDIRTLDHILYTPAPDIVHEAAGHAPILVDPSYAEYLRQYASVAKKAIITKKDFEQYEAIRVLSDIKEDPSATAEQIEEAEANLIRINGEITEVSEAGWLSRMNWWTAEYGLVGDINSPQIYGAGLLSSVGEAKECLSDKVKKIPLSVDCINTSYDITEPQPQLFVTPDFHHLTKVLEDLADLMAFRIGGKTGIQRAIDAETVNTAEFNSGLQISGLLERGIYDDQDNPVFLKFSGPVQICLDYRELDGHSKTAHAEGYSTPIGIPTGFETCLSQMTIDDLNAHGVQPGAKVEWSYPGAVQLKGTIASIYTLNGKAFLIQFSECHIQHGATTLYDPAWGIFDLALVSGVRSVFGGSADRDAYGERSGDFVNKRVPAKSHSSTDMERHAVYAQIRNLRENSPEDSTAVGECWKKLSVFPNEWLARLELLELAPEALKANIQSDLDRIAKSNPEFADRIKDGLKLLK